PDGDALPGGEERTRQMEPTPSLLRAAAVAKEKRKAKASGEKSAEKPTAERRAPAASGPVETDSALMRAVRHRRAPLVIALTLIGAGAAAAAFVLVKRATSKLAPPPSSSSPAPVAVAPPIAAKPVKVAHAKKAPHRIEPVDVPSPRLKKEKPGALPHKKVAAETTPIAPPKNAPAASAPAASAPPKTAPAASAPVAAEAPKPKATEPAAPPPEDLPSDSTPMTEEEQA